MEEKSEAERFYERVSDLLGVENPYVYSVNTHGGMFRTRWNNRQPGNGRFEGMGLVRFFGPQAIQVNLHSPARVVGNFDSVDAALSSIKKALDARRKLS